MSEEEAKIEIDKENNEVVIRLPFLEKLSSTGKMVLICNSRGWQNTGTIHKGKPVWLNASAGTKVRG